MKRISLVLALLAMMAQGIAQNEETSKPLANKPRELSIGVKAGKSFYNNFNTEIDEKVNVFYGAVGLNYGICPKDRFYCGIGVDVEYLDMNAASITVPLYAQGRAFLVGNKEQGLFVDAKAGYTFGGKSSLPLEERDPSTGSSTVVGKTERSLSGFYVEGSVGFRLQKIDFYVAYDFRQAHYFTDYYNENEQYVDHTDHKPIHTVMVGVRYVIY